MTRSMTAVPRWAALPRRQTGAVLIVAMILLVILTLLGVTAMNTTSLEEKMATNNQEQVRAFQAAETGLSQAFNDNDAYDISGTYSVAPAPYAGTTNEAGYQSDFLGFSPPPPGSLYSATSFQAAHFNFQSTGTAGRDITVILNGGAYQIAPKM